MLPVMLNVKQPEKITATYRNRDNEIVMEEFDGLFRVFLHEYDHMLGQNFLQRVSKLKLERAIKKFKKMDKKGIFDDVIDQKVNYDL